ncbi:hypothetical protein, partial [Streptomyces sp. OspMP-M43]|uniref:hypothetical protein n=1 Tax=Streptomyces sp. OspMP-M43 TaxID=1839781 RepID=UPI001961566F
ALRATTAVRRQDLAVPEGLFPAFEDTACGSTFVVGKSVVVPGEHGTAALAQLRCTGGGTTCFAVPLLSVCF